MSDNHDDYEDIVLSELDDNELVEQMHEDLYDGLAEEIAEGTQILLDRGWEATKVLDEALVEGMVLERRKYSYQHTLTFLPIIQYR